MIACYLRPFTVGTYFTVYIVYALRHQLFRFYVLFHTVISCEWCFRLFLSLHTLLCGGTYLSLMKMLYNAKEVSMKQIKI